MPVPSRHLATALTLAFASLAGCAATTPPVAVQASPPSPPRALATEALTLTTADGRTLDVMATMPEKVRGVIIFSHGGNSSPGQLRLLYAHLASEGFAVLAPLHTDSLEMPEDRRTDLQGAFPTRVADMQAVGFYAAERFPDLPLGLVGYSYGALSALVGAGALSPMIPGQIDGVDAVVMFSSPGPIPGLVDAPGAFADVTEPTLLVTGTADVVPGFVPDPALHLVYFDRLPAGDHTAFVVQDATHGFIAGREPGMDFVAPLAMDFLKSRMLGDATATARYDAAQSADGVEVRRK